MSNDDGSPGPDVPGFETLGRLGASAIGVAWHVRCRETGRTAALALLSRPVDAMLFAALQHDIERLQLAPHPCALPYRKILRVGPDCGVVGDLGDGYSVTDWIRRKGKLKVPDVLVATENIVSGLAHAWEREGAFHAHISPAAMLVGQDHLVKISGFGLEKYVRELLADAGGMSTDPYVAPEQLDAGAGTIDFRADMYSLGAVLQTMLLGRPPTRESAPKGPNDRRATSPLGRLINRLQAPDPADRPPDWPAVLTDVQAMLSGSTAAKPPAAPAVVSIAPKATAAQDAAGPPTAVPSASAGAKEAPKTIIAPRRRRRRRGRRGGADRQRTSALAIGGALAVAALAVGYWLWPPAADVPAIRPTEKSAIRSTPTDRETPRSPADDRPPPPAALAMPTATPAPPASTPNVLPDVLGDSDADDEAIWWRVGKLNGIPEDGFTPLVKDEYSVLQTNAPVTHVRRPEQFPQVMGNDQSFVVHLGSLPQSNAILRLAVTSFRFDQREYDEQPCDFERRQLWVQWNGQTLWRRWVAAGHQTLEMYIPGDWVHPRRNLLAIRNTGKAALCFDAAWLGPYELGPEVEVALTDADELARKQAPYAPAGVKALPPPRGDAAAAAELAKRLRTRPRWTEAWSQTRARKLWSGITADPVLAPDLVGGEGRFVDTAWRRAMGQMLERGMRPVVETDATETDEPAWTLWAQRYGPFVADWILRGNKGDVERVAAQIRQRAPAASILWATDPAELGSLTAARGIDRLVLSRQSGYWGRRTDWFPGMLRAAAWRGGAYAAEPFDHWLRLLPPRTSSDFVVQRKHAWMVSEGIVQWLMAGGNKIVLPSSRPGGIFFPDHPRAPAITWDAVRWLLQIGRATAHRSVANIAPRAGTRPLGDTFWAVAGQASNMVTLIVSAGYLDRERTVDVTVPVPWTGRTIGSIDSLLFHGRQDNPEPPRREPVALKAAPSVRPADSNIVVKVGRLFFPLTLESVHLVRLLPAGGTVPEQRIEQTARAGSEGPLVTPGMFRPRRQALPRTISMVEVRTPDDFVDRLSPAVNHERGEPRRGEMRDWSLQKHDTLPVIRPLADVAPWAEESELITLRPSLLDPQRPHGLRLYWDAEIVEKAEAVALWMRGVASAPPPAPAGPRRGPASLPAPLPRPHQSVVVGAVGRRENLRVRNAAWQLYTVSVDSLRDGHGRVPDYLTFWPSGDHADDATVEVNGILALSSEAVDGAFPHPCQGLVRVHESESTIMLGLIGKPGRPGYWRCRLQEDVDVVDCRAIGVKRRGRRVALGQRPPPGARDPEAFTWQYRPASHVLEIEVHEFPAAGDRLDRSLLAAGFTGLPSEEELIDRSLLALSVHYRE